MKEQGTVRQMPAKSFLSLRVIDALETRTVLAVRSDFFGPVYMNGMSETISLVFK